MVCRFVLAFFRRPQFLTPWTSSQCCFSFFHDQLPQSVLSRESKMKSTVLFMTQPWKYCSVIGNTGQPHLTWKEVVQEYYYQRGKNHWGSSHRLVTMPVIKIQWLENFQKQKEAYQEIERPKLEVNLSKQDFPLYSGVHVFFFKEAWIVE